MRENTANDDFSESGDLAVDSGVISNFILGSRSDLDSSSRWWHDNPSHDTSILPVSASSLLNGDVSITKNDVQECSTSVSDTEKNHCETLNPLCVPRASDATTPVLHNITSSPNLHVPDSTLLEDNSLAYVQRRLSDVPTPLYQTPLSQSTYITSPGSSVASITSVSRRSSAKKFSLYYSLAPSYKSKLERFRRIFLGTPVDTDRLLVDYSCALSKNNHGLLLQGRMYVTENWICFYSKILQEQKIYLSVKEIIAITKEKTARVIPNAIQLLYSRSHQRFFFTSFASRERTYAILRKVWENCRNHQTMSIDEIVQQVREIYGDDSLAMLEDEDSEGGADSPAAACRSQVDVSAQYTSSTDSTDGNLRAANGQSDNTEWISSSNQDNSVNKCVVGTTDEDDLEAPQFHLSTEMNNNVIEAHSTSHLSINDEPKRRSKKRHKRTHHHEPHANATGPSAISKAELLSFPMDSSDDCATCFPGHDHPGQLYVDKLIPLSVDALFACIFTDSEFFDRLSLSRGTFNMVQAPWPTIQWSSAEYKCSDPASTVERVIGYTLSLKQKLGPRTCAAVERQTLLVSESRPRQCYVIDAKVTNQAVPLCNCFCVVSRYCLLRAGRLSSRLSVHSRVVYEKPVFFGAKGIIENTCRSGLTDFFTSLTSQLTELASSLSDEDRLTGGFLAAPSASASVSHADPDSATGKREKKIRGTGDYPNDRIVNPANMSKTLSRYPSMPETKANSSNRNSGSPFHKTPIKENTAFNISSPTHFTMKSQLFAFKEMTCFFLRPDRAWLLLCFISLLLCLCLSLVYTRLVALEQLAEQLSTSAGSALPDNPYHSVEHLTLPKLSTNEESDGKLRIMKELTMTMSQTLSQMQQILSKVQSTIDLLDSSNSVGGNNDPTPPNIPVSPASTVDVQHI